MMPDPRDAAAGVRGERAQSLVNAARSVQSRLSGALAGGLMLLLGVLSLSWYYAHALARPQQARQAAQAASRSRAQGEMPLPALGRIDPPAAALPVPEPATATLPAGPPAALPLAQGTYPGQAAGEVRAAPPAAPGLAPNPPDRRLTGAVFTRAEESGPAPAAAGAGGGSSLPARPDAGDQRSGAREDSLAALLQAPLTLPAAAHVLPGTRLLLPKGAFIDCTLETAIDSTLPGMTTCITAADTFGADGKVVLLERGTKLVGETRGQVQQGQARVFVAWAEARTPAGVIVPLDSPGTDELGRAGLPGTVERHFWQRFGAAMLISIVDGAVQAGVQASTRSGGTVVYAPAASQDVATEVLKDTVNIAPTVVKRNGDRIQVLVARDVDFRPVYELRAAAGR